ncbi:MAG: hypothetical protein RL660_1854 [Bacteroidota bacterium]|jgi:hypothetical protein
MNTFIKVLSAAAVFGLCPLSANAQSSYVQEFGNNAEHDGALSLCDKGNGEILTLGYQKGIGSTTWDMFYVTNFDKDGNKVKSTEIGYVVNHKGKVIRKTSDGGYILGGDGKWCTGQTCGNDGMLVKLDNALNIVWSSAVGGLFPIDDIADVRETNGGFYVLANVGSPTTGLDFCVVKLNTNGDTIWTRTFSSYDNNASSEDRGFAIATPSDGSVVVLGRAYDASNSSYNNVSLMKINSNGTIAWSKVAKGFSTIADELLELSDGYLFINSWGRLVKVDLNGDFVWQKGAANGGLTPSFYKVNKDLVGNILVCGAENSKAIMAQIKPDGTTMFAKKYNTSNDSYLDDIMQLSDGRIAACGYTTINTFAQSLLITASDNGSVGGTCLNNLSLNFQDVTPNPSFVNYNYMQIANPVYIKITATSTDITNGNHSFTQSCKGTHWTLGLNNAVANDINIQAANNNISISGSDINDVKIFTIDGQLIYSATDSKSIDAYNFAAGIYLVRATNKNRQVKCEKVCVR